MNFRTESFDFPQNEQRKCLSCDMANLYRECGSPDGKAGSAGGAACDVLENKDLRVTGSSNTIRRPILVNVFTSGYRAAAAAAITVSGTTSPRCVIT